MAASRGTAAVRGERPAHQRGAIDSGCHAAASREADALAVVDGITAREDEAAAAAEADEPAAAAADTDTGEVDWAGWVDG